MTKTEYQRERRAKKAARGYCVECCARPVAPGSGSCDVCLSRWRDRAARKLQQDAFNTCCQAHGFHRSDCRRAA